MKLTKPLLILTLAIAAINIAPSLSFAADKMMMKNDKMMMMEHKDMAQNQSAYSDESFDHMVKNKENFVVAFHKKGCPDCAEQQNSFNMLYKDPAYKGLKVLVVDFDNDTASLSKFNVGQQTTLISFKKGIEVARSTDTTINGIQEFLAK